MKKTNLILAASGLLLSIVILNSFTNKTASTGAPPSHTGAPDEQTCARSGCHGGSIENTGSANLSFSIANENTHYLTGETYNITVTLEQDSIERFGFQVTAIRNTDQLSAGTITLTESDRTQIIQGANEFEGRHYITYKYAGTDPVEEGVGRWTFQWTAPADDEGPVTFYVAAVAANNDGTDNGDTTYITSWQMDVDPSASVTGSEQSLKFSVYPNPVFNELQVDYALMQETNTKIALYDFQGKKIQQFLSKQQEPGNYRQSFVINKPVSKGVYLLQLQKNNRSQFRRVIVTGTD